MNLINIARSINKWFKFPVTFIKLRHKIWLLNRSRIIEKKHRPEEMECYLHIEMVVICTAAQTANPTIRGPICAQDDFRAHRSANDPHGNRESRAKTGTRGRVETVYFCAYFPGWNMQQFSNTCICIPSRNLECFKPTCKQYLTLSYRN